MRLVCVVLVLSHRLCNSGSFPAPPLQGEGGGTGNEASLCGPRLVPQAMQLRFIPRQLGFIPRYFPPPVFDC